MKIKDVKTQPKVNEDLSNWVGDYGASRLRQLGARLTGKNIGAATGEQRQVMDMFIRNMVGDAIMSVNQAIQSGMVVPTNAQAASPAAAPSQQPTIPQQAQPATSTRDPQAGAKAKAKYELQKQVSQDLNNYVRNVSASLNAEPNNAKKMALAKELVNFMADRQNYPEWKNALVTAQQVIKKNITDPNFANSAINRLKAGQVMEAWQAYWINKLLESIGFTFADLGLTLLKENKNNGKYIIAEAKYYKLNRLFEGILNEAMTVGQYLKDRWLPNYAKKKGINISQDTADIERVIKQVEDNWNKDQGKTTLPQLGSLLFSIYQAQPQAGAQADAGQQTPAAQPIQAQPAQAQPKASGSGAIINSLQSLLTKLQSMDPALYADVIKKINAGQSLVGK